MLDAVVLVPGLQAQVSVSGLWDVLGLSRRGLSQWLSSSLLVTGRTLSMADPQLALGTE